MQKGVSAAEIFRLYFFENFGNNLLKNSQKYMNSYVQKL